MAPGRPDFAIRHSPFAIFRWPRTPREAFWLTAAAGVAGGLAIIGVVAPLTGVSAQFGGSAHDGFLELARSLAAGRGFVFGLGGPPVLHRPPLYPFLLAVLTFGPDWLLRPLLVVLQSALLGAMGLLLFRLGERLYGLRVARVSLAMFLAYPWVYFQVKNPMSIVLQALLYLALADFAVSLLLDRPGDRRARPAWRDGLGLGLLTGAAILTHASMLISATAIVLIVLAEGLRRRSRRLALCAGVALAIAAATVAPWTIRNWLVAKQFIPVASNAGLTYFAGNAHWGLGGPAIPSGGDEIAITLQHAGVSEAHRPDFKFFGALDPALSADLDARAKRDIRAHPGQFALKCALNLLDDFLPLTADVFVKHKPAAAWLLSENCLLTVAHLALLMLGAIGLRRAKPVRVSRTVAAAALLGPVALYVAPYLPFLTFVGHAQYTFGAIVFLDVAAAAGVVSLLPARDRGAA
jgi:hypothetical protein